MVRMPSSWNRSLVCWPTPGRQATGRGARKAASSPGEMEGEFRARLTQLAREQRDRKLAKLEKRYAPKLARLNERIRKAEARIGREKSQYTQQKVQTAISVGATVLGALFGRKVASAGTVGRATTAMRGAGRTAREKGDIARAKREVEAQQQRLAELEDDPLAIQYRSISMLTRLASVSSIRIFKGIFPSVRANSIS